MATGGFERNAEMRRTYLPGSWNPEWSGSVKVIQEMAFGSRKVWVTD